jgi:hypothetical protein
MSDEDIERMGQRLERWKSRTKRKSCVGEGARRVGAAARQARHLGREAFEAFVLWENVL